MKNNIGTKNESSLHKALKAIYVGKKGMTEIKINGFVCDGITFDDEIIEIQTGSFKPLYKKLSILCKKYCIKIVHPIILKKNIHLFDKNNLKTSLRKSPKKGNVYDLFDALVYAPAIALLPNIRIELVLVDIDEIRKQDGKGYWRRRGISIIDKILKEKRGQLILSRLKDYKQFIPFKKNEIFSITKLSQKVNIPYNSAAMCIYVLRKLGLIKDAGKNGRTKLCRLG
jgi:predicted transcriptional regulator